MHKRLKDLREDHDLTQKQIAEILGIRQPDYGKYERGINMMGVDKYIKLAQFYNVSLDYLLGLTQTPQSLYEKEAEKQKIDRLQKAYLRADKNIRKAIDLILNIKE